MKVFVVLSRYVHHGDQDDEVRFTVCATKEKAAEVIGDNVKIDLQFADWNNLPQCVVCDKDGKEISDGENIPDLISYFKAWDDDGCPMNLIEYWIEEREVI